MIKILLDKKPYKEYNMTFVVTIYTQTNYYRRMAINILN